MTTPHTTSSNMTVNSIPGRVKRVVLSLTLAASLGAGAAAIGVSGVAGPSIIAGGIGGPGSMSSTRIASGIGGPGSMGTSRAVASVSAQPSSGIGGPGSM